MPDHALNPGRGVERPFTAHASTAPTRSSAARNSAIISIDAQMR
jgi:hypothetical protein